MLFFKFLGSEVVVVKNGRRICGTGAAFSNAPINQDKAYFEIKVQSSGKLIEKQNNSYDCNCLYLYCYAALALTAT